MSIFSNIIITTFISITPAIVLAQPANPILGSHNSNGEFLPPRYGNAGVRLDIPFSNESDEPARRPDLNYKPHRYDRREGIIYYGDDPYLTGDDMSFEGRRREREQSRRSKQNDEVQVYYGRDNPANQPPQAIQNTTVIVNGSKVEISPDGIVTVTEVVQEAGNEVFREETEISFQPDNSDSDFLGEFTNITIEDNEPQGTFILMPDLEASDESEGDSESTESMP